jgi:phosphoadenosine phosphosulfate reductase
VELKRPDTTVEEYEQQHGGPLYRTKPDQCCFDRKVKVLERAVVGMHAWASAIRRDQSPDRANAPIVGWDKKFSLVKVSPLANWTKKDVWGFITEHDIPYNPLHDQGYTSIGCWPCTRAVPASAKTSGPAAGAALPRPSAGCTRSDERRHWNAKVGSGGLRSTIDISAFDI